MSPGQMAAGDVPGFVGDHTNYLSGGFGTDQKARINEKVLAARDKGVELVVVYEVGLNGLSVQPRGFENWCGVGANDIFNLDVPDHGQATRPRRSRPTA